VQRPAGLRARKKARTQQAISDAAITLFLASGYDAVSVADVAAAAEVSKPTLFKYFATKEDLVLHRFADHEDEPARVVRGRARRESPLDALHRHFVAGLHARDPITGLSDVPEVQALQRLVLDTPALAARFLTYTLRGEGALAAALQEAAGDQLAATAAAGQIIAVQRILATENCRLVASGRSATEILPEAVAAADRAFALLRGGLGGVYG
jgi:AcrR family transcriptional regulator